MTQAVTRQGGGVAEAVRILGRAISDQPGIQANIIALQYPGYEADLPALEGLDVRFHRFFGPSNYGFSPGLLWDLARSRADLVHVHGIWGFHVLAVHIWHLLTGGTYVLTPHGMLEPWILKRSRFLKAAVSRLYQDAFLAGAAGLQIFAEAERPAVSAKVPGAAISTIANQIETPPRFGPPPTWWSGWLEERQIFLFLGRIHTKKGILELLDAWDQVCAGDPKFRDGSSLIVAGWHDGLEEFDERLAAVAARQGNVTMVGPQFGDAKWASYRAADFFILPSKSEGQPMAVLEAWACGVPVIMTEACNLNIGFDAGAALKTGTRVAEIAETLVAAAALTEAERAAMSRAGLDLVDAQFSMRVIGGKMAEFYSRSAGRPMEDQPAVMVR